MSDSMKLFRWTYEAGRGGSLQGVFASTQEIIDAAIGEKAYFGEVLGKHSDVVVVLASGQFETLTDDQDFIDKATKYGLVDSGHNPLEYLNPEG